VLEKIFKSILKKTYAIVFNYIIINCDFYSYRLSKAVIRRVVFKFRFHCDIKSGVVHLSRNDDKYEMNTKDTRFKMSFIRRNYYTKLAAVKLAGNKTPDKLPQSHP